MNAKELMFQILDKNGSILLGRTVKFPYPIDVERLDKEMAEIFLRISNEKIMQVTKSRGNKKYKERKLLLGLCSICGKQKINYNRSDWKCTSCLEKAKIYKLKIKK